ncbi:MAG: ribosome hibernation-promoting factor, HPF/YfiA family [Flavobacteriales bacterium]
MQIKIHSVHFDADQKLKEFVQEKLGKLERFDENIIGMEVFLRDENDGEKNGKTVEGKVFVPGKDLFAKKSSSDFGSATDDLLGALQRQVKKHKEKLRGA